MSILGKSYTEYKGNLLCYVHKMTIYHKKTKTNVKLVFKHLKGCVYQQLIFCFLRLNLAFSIRVGTGIKLPALYVVAAMWLNIYLKPYILLFCSNHLDNIFILNYLHFTLACRLIMILLKWAVQFWLILCIPFWIDYIKLLFQSVNKHNTFHDTLTHTVHARTHCSPTYWTWCNVSCVEFSPKWSVRN